ncbi:hypothetical protein [Nocardia sp. JCM 34519.1]
MYDIASRDDVIVVTKETVMNNVVPTIVPAGHCVEIAGTPV